MNFQLRKASQEEIILACVSACHTLLNLVFSANSINVVRCPLLSEECMVINVKVRLISASNKVKVEDDQ